MTNIWEVAMKYLNKSEDIQEALGGDIYTVDVNDVDKFYEEYVYSKLSSTGLETLLKALKIPVKFFLKQPHETRVELLQNQKADFESDRRFYVLVKNDQIVYISTVKRDMLQFSSERCPVGQGWTFLEEDYVAGYVRYFVPIDPNVKDGYSLGVFVQYPILFQKPLIIQTGFYKQVNKYGNSSELIIPDFKIKLKGNKLPDTESNAFFNDIIEELKETKAEKFLEALEGINVDSEATETYIVSIKERKLVSKGLVDKVTKYLAKNEGVYTMLEFIDLFSAFTNNLTSFTGRIKARENIMQAFSVLSSKKIPKVYAENFIDGY